jgi:hypothetical protein
MGSQSGFPLLTPNVPFQGFARRSGIQVFRLYSRASPVTESQWRSVMVRVARVSPSHPYNAGRAGLGWGGWVDQDGM